MLYAIRKSAYADCAALLRKNRRILVEALIHGIKVPRKKQLENEDEEVFAQRVGASVDLLIGHIEGRAGYGALYAGQQMFELYRRELPKDKNVEFCRCAVSEDHAVLTEFLIKNAGHEILEAFGQAYRSATLGLVQKASKHVRTLFVADCLTVEIASFLLGPLMSDGISIDPYEPPHAPGKIAAACRRSQDVLRASARTAPGRV